MIRFQFGNGQDFVLLDPADYASALGAKGLAKYETELAKVSATVQLETGASENQAAGPLQPDGTAAWQRRGEHTHAGDQTRSCKLQHTATALAEIGETGLAIDWAHRGALLESGHQAEAAAGASCCTSNGPGTRQAHV